MLTVVTGWSPEGYKTYGRTFAETFHRYWPKEVRLVVYGEEPVKLPRGEFRRLYDIPGVTDFLREHSQDPEKMGKATNSRWKDKERANGYSYRFDAVKFFRQGFIPEAAAAELDPDEDPQFLCWLDGDVVTHAPVPAGAIESLMAPGCSLAFLGRGQKHSEIGFQLYRLAQGEADQLDLGVFDMLSEFRRIYASGEVFNLREWHSAFVFDEARRRTGVLAHDLTPGGRGHVWQTTPLARWMVHLKGDRKYRAK